MIGSTLLVASLIALLGSGLLGVASLVLRWAEAPRLATTGPAVRPRRSGLAGTQLAGLWLALALLLTALAVRAVTAGHAPWSNLHEFSQAFAAGIIVTYLLLARRHPISGLATPVAVLAAAGVALALMLPSRIDPLVPALQQPVLLTVHVGSAVLAYAISAVAFAAAVAELAQRRAGGRLAALPSVQESRTVAHRAVLIAFPILTAAIVLGAVWANLAWRSFWSNDPKEVGAAATWLMYAAYLHVAGRSDRWGATAPWMLIAGFAMVLFTLLAVSFLFPGQHSYAAG